MTLYMLDTNAASEAIRGHPRVDARLSALQPGQWCVSAVTLSELQFGLAQRPEAVKLRRLVEAFLRVTPVHAWDAQAAAVHGALRSKLRSRGKPIGDFDEMIAAHALAEGAVLVTDNLRHFQRVEGLLVENWIRSTSSQ